MPPVSPPKEATPGDRHPPTRCVLWRPGATPTPPELLTSLHKRAIDITDCTDGFAALAHICKLEHAPPDRIILLLVSPTLLDDAPGVLDTAGRYAPHAACWWYDARTSEKLQRITPADIAGWSARMHASPAGGAGDHDGSLADDPRSARISGSGAPGEMRRPPALRLTSDPDAAAFGAHADDAPEPDPASDSESDGDTATLTPTTLLSNEELAMLLAEPPAAAATPDGAGGPNPATPRPAASAKVPWWRRPDSGADR